MSEPDEFDAFYLPIDSEDIAGIEAATARALARDKRTNPLPDIESSYISATQAPTFSTSPQPPAARSPPSPDEFDAYDFSEFTDEDFAHIDAMVRTARAKMHPSSEHGYEGPAHPEPAGDGPGSGIPGPRGDGVEDGDGRGPDGGPRIQIAVEKAANADLSRYLQDDPASHRREPPKRTPYEQLRCRSRLLSVPDLAAPSWSVGS